MSALSSLAGVSDKPLNPLAVSGPSPMMLLNYPLVAANVRILCDPDLRQSVGRFSLATTFLSIRTSFRKQGIIGVYQGGHLYLLHQVCRDLLRYVTDLGFRLCRREGREVQSGREERGGPGCDGGKGGEEDALSKVDYKRKLATKYLIDALCYPMLLASTRAVLLSPDAYSWQACRTWCREEGPLIFFSGMTASLLSTALDEIMDWVLGWCVDHCSMGSDIEVTDKVLLKASGSSVASVFTAPVNYIGVIQRCQSHSFGKLEPEPLWHMVWSLPWKGSAYQFLMFSGVLALNVKLIQLKVQLGREVQEMEGEDHPTSE